MRGIVMHGLGYLVRVVKDMEEREVVLLRHYVMDQMYALLAYTPPLDEDAFGKRGYIITYYDHPLQEGIQPSWSDQNEGRPRAGAEADLRTVDADTFRRRQLAALEWQQGAGVGQQVPAPKAEAAQEDVPGEGLRPERLRLAVRALVKREPDLGSFSARRLRQELERILRLEAGGLEDVRSSVLMAIVFDEIEQAEEEAEGEEAGTVHGAGRIASPMAPVAATGVGGATPEAKAGGEARVKATGRIGEIVLHDPDDRDLTFKLRFSDGQAPEMDWFGADMVEPLAGA
jgi:hypothetical protein